MGGKLKPCKGYWDICLGFGSNIGDTEINLLKAINTVKNRISGITIFGVSSVYLSSPVENTNQPYFLNCAVLFRLVKPVRQFLNETYGSFGKQFLFTLKDIEKNMGRKNVSERYMPRIIDIDMLFIYDNASKNFVTLDLPELKLPHAGIFGRKFVLYPLLDLSDYIKKPFDKESIKKALSELENSDAGASQKISYCGKFDENLSHVLR
ncbi:MAG: 2-amino-4-hydroxy-6-hydroxymethyldihydropteridine diphosphokinase [bacterium]